MRHLASYTQQYIDSLLGFTCRQVGHVLAVKQIHRKNQNGRSRLPGSEIDSMQERCHEAETTSNLDLARAYPAHARQRTLTPHTTVPCGQQTFFLRRDWREAGFEYLTKHASVLKTSQNLLALSLRFLTVSNLVV